MISFLIAVIVGIIYKHEEFTDCVYINGGWEREYFQDFIEEEEEEEEEEDVGLACLPFDEEDFMAAKASYSDLSEEVFFSRIDNDQKSKSYLSGYLPGVLDLIIFDNGFCFK